MSIKRLTFLNPAFLAFAASVMIGGFASSAQAQRVKAKLSVGSIAPLSGPMAFYGKDLINGMALAVEVIKSRDADLGGRLTIVPRDNAGKAEETARVAQSLIENRQADVIFGTSTSITTEALIDVTDRFKKPLIAPAATDDLISKPSSLLRTSLDNTSIGTMISQFATTTLKQRSAVVLYDASSAYSTAISKAFVTDFTRRGGKVTETLNYRQGDGSFRNQLTTIKKLNPGVIIVPGFYEEVGRIMKQAMQLGIRTPMIGTDGWDSPNLIRIAGKRAVRGHYFLTHFSTEDPDKKVQAFVNTFRRRFNKLPTTAAAMGYDGMLVLADAFQRARTNLPEQLQRALNSTTTVEGLLGPITFSENKRVSKPSVVLSTTGSGWRFHSRIAPEIGISRQGG